MCVCGAHHRVGSMCGYGQVRCGAYKLHWVTSTWQAGSNNGVFHDPPLLFNLDIDPGENFPIVRRLCWCAV